MKITGPLQAYYEAFETHVDRCDGCSWATSDLCHVGQSLLKAAANRAATVLAPIPVMLPRPAAKA